MGTFGERKIYTISEADAEHLAPSDQGVEYLSTTWLPYKRRWAQPWTNQIRHFAQLSTSRVEGAHATLKKYLQISTGDLETVVNNIELLLTAQQVGFLSALSQAATRIPHEAKIPIFCYILHFITPYALRKVLRQYQDVADLPQLSSCTGVFTQTMGLPCAHQLRHAIDSETPLTLSHFHSHWHIKPLVNPSVPLQYGSEIFLQDPPRARPKGRPQAP